MSKNLKDSFLKEVMIGDFGDIKLKTPLISWIEKDGEGFICRIEEFPIFGYGDTIDEAIKNLILELETLYKDLNADDNFSEEWLKSKKLLNRLVK